MKVNINYQNVVISKDLLVDSLNRMITTDELDELIRLHSSAIYDLEFIFSCSFKRISGDKNVL